MRFTLTIECDNAAFADDERAMEVARILREVADECDAYDIGARIKLRDLNGNTVGRACFEGD